ncbi:MAG: tripartite tricarboxylate transporter TctB family protein [Roseobacter sp.]
MEPITKPNIDPVSPLQKGRSLIAGGVLLGGGLVFVVGGLQLGLGSPFRLGTGAFPFLTGLLLFILAVPICLQDWRSEEERDGPDWVSFLAIGAALAVFAASADRLGLVPAVFFSIIVASAPDRTLPIIGKLILGTIVSLASWGLFVVALNLPLKAFAGV